MTEAPSRDASTRPSRLTLSAALAAMLIGLLPIDAEARQFRWQHNGRCDDPRYETSNGGRARPGTDEFDCSRHGDGLKRSADRGYRGGWGSSYDEDDEDDADLGTVAAVVGGVAVLGILGSLLGGSDASSPPAFTPSLGMGTGTGLAGGGTAGQGIVWNDAPAAPAPVLMAEADSACQATVARGIAERFGNRPVRFAEARPYGDGEEGTVMAGSDRFSYRCAGGAVNVW
ncbi:hypothetical protein [Arenibaculum pallidiluteum]|uniref:hypothetical protein n=1 Tax=Arenibaculum pallidiluteum TaxID=2812559 RepID=UPI001A95B6C8|nr:hypothetical protein [Arenibaculum pallidiluteum]